MKKSLFFEFMLNQYRRHLILGIFNSISIAVVYWLYMTNKINDLKCSPSPELTNEQIIAYRESIEIQLSSLYDQRLLITVLILVLSYPFVIFIRVLIHENENIIKAWSSYKTNEFK